MNWLARLKKTSVCAETDPTKTTKTVFVVSVAPISAYSEKTGGGTAAANDPAPAPKPDRLQAAARALDAVIVASDMAANPDRWCWPQGAAMNTAEIELFTFRLARFTDRGLTLEDADVLADFDYLRRDAIQSGDAKGRGRPSDRYTINPAALRGVA